MGKPQSFKTITLMVLLDQLDKTSDGKPSSRRNSMNIKGKVGSLAQDLTEAQSEG